MPCIAKVSPDLPKVAQELLDDFGAAVKRARSLKGWELNDVANRIAEMEKGKSGSDTNAPARSFLSDIEKGKRSISTPTVGKLIHALGLPESWLDRFLQAAPDDIDEETPKDREVDRLILRVEADESAPATAEPLLLLLAEEWAGRGFTDSATAYAALRGALQAAADLKAQGALPSNSSDQLQAVLRRVSELNDLGQTDAADATLAEAAERNKADAERNAAEAEALFEAHLKQDRLRNRPADAAKRLIARLKAKARPEGLFAATQQLVTETWELGERQGDPFDLAVALDLAKANHDRAKGPQVFASLTDLGNCHLALGQRQASGGHLTRARNAHADALRLTSRQRDPQNWAMSQNNLGNALQTLGERTADPALLEQAVAAHRAALTVYTPEAAQMDWAMSQHNLAIACLSLHAARKTVDWLDEAETGFGNALKILTRDRAEYRWADSCGGLGKVSLARFRVTGDRSYLDVARNQLAEAREVFAADPDNVALHDFDRLLAEINAS